jgi:hypothetical protein
MDLDTARENICIAKMEIQRAWNALKATLDDIFNLQLRPFELLTAGSGNEATVQRLRQHLKAKEAKADSAYNAQREAKEQISRLQSVLNAANQDSQPICGVMYQQKCKFTRSASRGSTLNMRHRFHKVQLGSKSCGLLDIRYQISVY